jgi:hypothetical protein
MLETADCGFPGRKKPRGRRPKSGKTSPLGYRSSFPDLRQQKFRGRSRKKLHLKLRVSLLRPASLREPGLPARPEGFNGALKRLIPNLDAALQRFRKRAQDDPAIKLRLARGYDTNAVRGGSR